ncbi:DNA-binding response regulator [Iocasia frigidifontis]|uniref:DNA-binding response regulator n=1 Tax=Iocasia fonsfrigidae TaxID=2682810 RepID=A0A8A7KD68_9FIRM|nr:MULTISPECIES: flavodoxin family protein [Halanaerobiaceae]AZO93902.1 flavodoxin family protein [Halocella sp. SP3-1]MTI59162.1 flavodoxin family protein [Bacillota bacterium]QTL96837.1 DNA-binding response regulator [Iocasia fonsfrigidae]
MKVLVIHAQDDKITKIAKAMVEGIVNNGNQADRISTSDTGGLVNFHSYDLVLVGSPTKGFFKGKIDENIKPFLGQCKRTVGKEAVAFVTPRGFATTKALKLVMAVLESLGCIVKDFVSLSTVKEARVFGGKL